SVRLCTEDGPISARLEPASRLRSVQHWFACAAPSDLAQRARTVWQYQHGSPSRGRLPPITVVPGDRLPRCFIRPLRRPNRDGLSPPPDTPSASWRTAPPRRNSPLLSRSHWPDATRRSLCVQRTAPSGTQAATCAEPKLQHGRTHWDLEPGELVQAPQRVRSEE